MICRHTLAVPRFAVAVLALSAVLAGCGGGGGGYSSEDLPNLVLQPGDLTKGFERFQLGPQKRADQFPGAQTDLQRFGREGGWKARFRRRGAKPNSPGPVLIESRADVFDSVDGAKKEFDAYSQRFDQVLNDAGALAEGLATPTIGDETTGITFRQPQAVSQIRYFAIAWREGNVTAAIIVNGFNGRVFPPEAFALARKQARRIEAAKD